VFDVEHLTPSQKGAVAEAAITSGLIQLGLTVLRPVVEGQRFDLAIDLGRELVRVQCKLARRLGGVIYVNLQTSRCVPGGYVRTSYSATEIDAASRGHETTSSPPASGACSSEPADYGRRRKSPLADSYTTCVGKRGYSSAGRALPWHGRGRRFEPD
jgi:PD-(D/E)XK endonuclease